MNRLQLSILFLLFSFVIHASKHVNDNLSLSINTPVKLIQNPQNETDSLKAIVQKCSTDTAKFYVLLNFFWQYAEKDLNRVKHVGIWAFEIIKNSKNLRALSDGYDIKGVILEKEMKYDSAYSFFQKALIASKKIGYHTRTGWSYYHLGVINNALGKIDSSIFYFKIDYNFNLEHNFESSACDILNDIAYVFQKNGNIDSALFYFKKSLKLSQQINDEYKELNAYFSLIDFYNKQNDIKNVLDNMNEALKLSEKSQNIKALTSIYIQIGDLFFNRKKNYDIALRYYKKVLEISDTSNNKYMKANALNVIGNVYLEEGNYTLAQSFSLQALKIAKEIKFKHQVSEAYNNLGKIYRQQGNLQKAINNFTNCWETGCDKCPKIKFHYALTEIADSYLKLNNPEKALEFYNKAMELAKEFDSNKELAISNLKLGNYYRYVKKSNPERYYLSAIEMAQKSNDLGTIKIIADTLSTFFKNKSNYKAAYQYQMLARTTNDSLIKIERQESMANWEVKFEFEKINKENEAKEILSKEEISRQKLFRNSALLISLLLGILGLVIFLSYRRKNKDNEILRSQRDEIIAKNHEIELQMEKILNQKEEIEQISERLHESDQSKLRFFANISHELRTPLTLIASPLAKLMKDNANDLVQNLYTLMLRNTRKLQELINQLLDISKIDKDELVLDLKMHDFIKQIRVIASMFQSIADEKNIDFRITRMQEDLIFCYDDDHMEQIVNNLLSNAFKFTSQNGKIEIKVYQDNDSINLKIKDSGIGISQLDIRKVFDRFYQTESTVSGNFGGSGIGLALTKELVELHHGKISVESELGKGTEFTIILPYIQTDLDEVLDDFDAELVLEKNGTDLYKLPKNETSKHKETILLVEDNNDLRAYMSQSLSVNYNVIEAQDGTEGVELAKKEIPDIIISDVMMPKTDGYQLTSNIRSTFETSHIPIILLTAKTGRESKIEGLERGADDYINKPFDEEELLLKVKNILNNRQRLQDKFKKQISPNPSEIETLSMDEQFIIKLVTIIEENISDNKLDVDHLGNNIGLSRQQLYRKLKAITGLSPVEFIRSIRIKRAAQLIKQKAATISEIAFLTGFENLSYFSKRFKEEFGILPSEYANSEN